MATNVFETGRNDFAADLAHLADSLRRFWEERPCIYVEKSGQPRMNSVAKQLLASLGLDSSHVVDFARAGAFFQKLCLNGLDMELTRLPGGALVIVMAGSRNIERESLTHRETEVLVYLVKGLTNKEIAEVIGVSPGTVNTHLDNLYRKLGCSSRIEACLTALAMGLEKT
ncbi:MAG: response regulator transcription factor [Nitrospiraceae bacterium]|nr:response regulator transcription factor [Nitrospiraceae bacterium]